MELLLVVAVWSIIVKKAIVDGAVDLAFAVRGKPSPRWGSKSRVRPDGAASRYFRELWRDSWEDASAKHSERRARRLAPTAPTTKPRGAATVFFANRWREATAGVRRSWDGAWVRADEKRRAKTTRPRPGQQTVPGTVVPNRDEQQDDPQDRPQDEPRPDPQTTQDSTDLTDQDGVRLCPGCGRRLATVGRLCPSCLDQQEDEADLRRYPPDAGPDQDIAPPLDPTTQEGTTTMTATVTEVVGLDSAIRFCEDSARAYRAQVQAIEHTQAAIVAGGVTGPAEAAFAAAMEQSNAAAASMEAAAAEFKAHKPVQEAYNSAPGAGTREFVTTGQ